MSERRAMTVAEFLEKAIDLSGKSQRLIAQEVGYAKPNVVSMMKQGITKIPLDKIPAFAKSCNVDPAAFMRIAMEEYWPEAWKTIQFTFGESLSRNEMALIETYRKIAPNNEIELDVIVLSRVEDAIKGE